MIRICRLPPEIQHQLRNVLDEADDELDVGKNDQNDQRSQPGHHMEGSPEDTEQNKKENGTKNGNGHFAHSLLFPLINKTLVNRKGRNEHGVSREE